MSDAQIFTLISHVVVIASVLHIVLPPYDEFGDFPRFQKYYKIFVVTVGYIALNARGKVIQAYPSVKQTQDESKP